MRRESAWRQLGLRVEAHCSKLSCNEGQERMALSAFSSPSSCVCDGSRWMDCGDAFEDMFSWCRNNSSISHQLRKQPEVGAGPATEWHGCFSDTVDHQGCGYGFLLGWVGMPGPSSVKIVHGCDFEELQESGLLGLAVFKPVVVTFLEPMKEPWDVKGKKTISNYVLWGQPGLIGKARNRRFIP